MKKRMPHLLVFLQLLFIFSINSSAQQPGDAFKKMASLPLQTPQATSLSKYVEYPVSYYNGLAQISLPVYELISGDISVPITLSYHGGGIRVQEEASWVGLGWNLSAGGAIVHEVKGGDDDLGIYHPFNQIYPNAQANAYVESPSAIVGTGCPGVYNSSGGVWNCDNLNQTLNGVNNIDGEPDIYAYNFGNYSGKFFSGNGQFVDVSHNNIQFTQQATAGFTAITPDGFKYEFFAVDKAWSYPNTAPTVTAYYLTKITSPRGKIVTFEYKSFKQMIDAGGTAWSNQFPNLSLAWGPENTVMQFPALTENFGTYAFVTGDIGHVPVPPGMYGLHRAFSSTTSTSLYLDRIVFDIGYIDFVKSPRTDLYGVKLDAINVYRGGVIKSIPFTYDYFVSTTGDDDMYSLVTTAPGTIDVIDGHVINYPTSYRNRRLKLLSVTTEASAHNFEYYEGDIYTMLPWKSSFSQDYWGYYNGRRGNPSLIPDYDVYSQQQTLPTSLSTWQGANRNPDGDYVRAGSLKRIIYPTGGFSLFTYEMHEWSNLSAPQLNTYRYVRHGTVDAGTGNQKAYFTITANTYCDISGGLFCNGMMDMNSPAYNCGCGYICSGGSPDALYAMIERVDPNTHAVLQTYPQWQFDISKDAVRNAGGNIGLTNQLFGPGTYCITVNYPDNHTPSGNIPANRRADLYVSFYEQVPGTNNSARGAGLRIASIKNFDPVNMQMHERKFSYSGGKIMRYPAYNADVLNELVNEYVYPDNSVEIFEAQYRFYYLYAAPAFPLSQSANGSAVGYDVVTESLVGPGSVGKTQYEYKNRPDNVYAQPELYMPGIPSTGFLDNGFLNRVAVYDNNNTLLKETLNTQLTMLSATYWPFKCRYWTNNDMPNFNLYLRINFYPIQVGKIQNLISTVKDYANGSSLTTSTSYAYNSKGLLSQESTTSSDGHTLTTHYTYASDYTGVSSGWIQDLKNRNMIGIPLEVYKKRNGLVTAGTFTTFLTHDNNITNADKIYEIETASPQSIPSTAPAGVIPAQLKLSGTLTYDASGNLVQTKAKNNVYTSYLWGYNKNYPVAQVIGADYATVNSFVTNGTVNPAVLADVNASDAVMRQELSDLRLALAGSKALVTTYTHLPLIGISSITDQKGLTTFYNYDNHNRLANIKDHQNNILKQYSYFYDPALKNVANNLFYNQETTRLFVRQCGPNEYGYTQIGTDVPYTVPAGKYVGINQQAADDAALEEINANGQANANLMGDCYVYAGPLEINSIENGTGTSVTIRYKCSFQANYYCQLFIQDVATGAYVGGGPYSLSQGQTLYTATNVPKGKQYRFWLQAQGSSYSATSPQTVIFLP